MILNDIIWQLNNNRSGETKPYASKNTVNSTNDNVQFWNFHKKGVPKKLSKPKKRIIGKPFHVITSNRSSDEPVWQICAISSNSMNYIWVCVRKPQFPQDHVPITILIHEDQLKSTPQFLQVPYITINCHKLP